MLYLFYGSDRDAARAALSRALTKARGQVVRITDAHGLADLAAALSGPGLFGREQTLVLDGIFGGDDAALRDMLADALAALSAAKDEVYLLEGGLDAATRKLLEKHAAQSQSFDAPKAAEEKTIFALANALQRGDRKALWVGLMREYAKGSAPEAVHGLLFWGAKQLALRASERSPERTRGMRLVAELAELPHAARRRGEDLSYALERFALSPL